MAVANASVRQLPEPQRRVLEGWLLEFDQAWADGLLDERARRLPPQGMPPRLPALAELVKIDLEHQWRRGRRPGLEDYLRRYPELGTPDSVAADLIQAEYEVHQQFGDTAGLADFRRRFPHQAEELARLLAEAREVVSDSELARPAGDTRPPHPTPAPAGSRPAPQELAGEFGRYRIEKRLGRGGMGSVYLAHDTQLDRRVALKVPHFTPGDGPKVLERFYREARAAATLDHPNICPVHEVGAVDGVPYLTMAYVEGKPLSALIGGGKRLTQPQAATVVRKLALALDEAHRKGVIHRDLKPANVMINARGEPVVMDFGLARRAGPREARLTHAGSILGTPAYMPPEQMTGDVDAVGPACDIYSLGVILYELLTGRLPFEGDVLAVLLQVTTEAAPPPSAHRPDLDPRLEAVCLKALAKKPEDRCASMADLARDLGEYLRRLAPAPPSAVDSLRESNTTRGASRLHSGAPPRRWRRVAVAAAGAGIVLLFGILIIVTTKSGKVTVRVEGPDAQVEVKTTEEGAPPAIPKTAVVPSPPGKPVDLLKLMDPADQFVASVEGPWQLKDGAFLSGHGVVQVPYVPPAEYRLEMTVQRLGPVHVLALVVPVGSHPAGLVLDGTHGGSGLFSGFQDLDGRPAGRNATTHTGHFLKDGVMNTVVCAVRRDAVQLLCNDRVVIDWKGDPQKLPSGLPDAPWAGRELAPFWRALPNPRVLYVRTSVPFRISRFVLTPLAGEGRPDADPGPEIRRLQLGDKVRVNGVAFSPDGRRVLGATEEARGGDGQLRLWDVASAREVWKAAGHVGWIWRAVFAPDGRRILSTGQDGTVRLWDAETGNALGRLSGHPGSRGWGLAVSPDGRLAASGADDGTVRLWQLPEPQAGNRGPPSESPRGTDPKSAPVRHFNGHQGTVGSVAFSPDGKRLLTGGADRTVRLWDVATGAQLRRFPGHKDHVPSVAFAPDGKTAASASGDHDVRVWDLETGNALGRLSGHQAVVTNVVFTPDGRRLLSASDDGTLRLWDVAERRMLSCLPGHAKEVVGMALSPDGRRAASGGWDGTMRVWRLPP